MIEQEFDAKKISSVNFGVCRSNSTKNFVPVDADVQLALRQMLVGTIARFSKIDGDWEEYSPSEDYGESRKIYASRSNSLMTDLSSLYDMGDLSDMANLQEHIASIDYYFAVFRDIEDRKIVGFRKASQLKGTLSARNRLVRIVDNSLKLIPESVLKLDQDFDTLVASTNIFVLNPRAMEHVANLVLHVASAAAEKVQLIQDKVAFLDLSDLKTKVGQHPRTARLAASIAARDDLDKFSREWIVELAKAQGIKLREVAGLLKPRVTDQHKLLEILDDRRYMSGLSIVGPIPFRASSRQKVTTT